MGRIWAPDAVLSTTFPDADQANQGMNLSTDLAGCEPLVDAAGIVSYPCHYEGPI